MGMRPLQSFLVRQGAVIPAGVTLTNVLAISNDGSTIVGLWQDANYHQGPWIGSLTPKTASAK